MINDVDLIRLLMKKGEIVKSKAIARETNMSTQSLSRRLVILKEHGFVEQYRPGKWLLKKKGMWKFLTGNLRCKDCKGFEGRCDWIHEVICPDFIYNGKGD